MTDREGEGEGEGGREREREELLSRLGSNRLSGVTEGGVKEGGVEERGVKEGDVKGGGRPAGTLAGETSFIVGWQSVRSPSLDRWWVRYAASMLRDVSYMPTGQNKG